VSISTSSNFPDPWTNVNLLRQLAEDVRDIKERLGQSESQSSVEIATSTRGTDIKVKCYPYSDVVQAGDAALEEYLRLRREIEQRLMDNFTQEAAKRSKA